MSAKPCPAIRVGHTPRPRSRTVLESAGLCARLSYYPPRSRMSTHRHAFHQLSLLLSGGLSETSGGRETAVDQQSLGFKPADLPHANCYGDDGALILSLNLDADLDWSAAFGGMPEWHWRAKADARAASLGQTLLRKLGSGAAQEAESLLVDLLARAMPAKTNAGNGTPRTTPAWLSRTRQRILDAPEHSLSELASAEGAHPVHLSRAFSQQFGCTLSAYRARARFARALPALLSGEPIAQAALAAGYADQAHLTRSARRQCGLTPRQLSTWLAAQA